MTAGAFATWSHCRESEAARSPCDAAVHSFSTDRQFLERGERKSMVSLAALGQINEVVKPPYRVVGNNTIWNWESYFARWN